MAKATAGICVGANDPIYLEAGGEIEREREVSHAPFRGHSP
jgi:hypothetical protein